MTTIPPNPEEALVTISTPQRDTVRVRDRVESSRFEFYFDDDVEITPEPTENAHFPIDISGRCSWPGRSIHIPLQSPIHVFESSTGNNIAVCDESNTSVELPEAGSILEVVTAPMKIYIALDSRGQVTCKEGHISIHLSDSTDGARIWSRSLHETPGATITTPDTVAGLMRAVSRFGSALKTTSPERSWPTLRGYPPDIAIGDRFDAPPSTTRPDVDVRIEIPRDIASVYQVTPLAYYCAASVTESGSLDSAAIVANGERIPLAPNRLSESASELLQRMFTLDCIVRTAGFYPAAIEGEENVIQELPWDIETMYEAPLEKRIPEYAAVPRGLIKDVQPRWPLTADITPTFDNVPALPHLAEELAIIRPPSAPKPSVEKTPDYIDGFVRADGGTTPTARTSSETTNSEVTDITSPEPYDTQLHTFLRESYPLGSNKTTIEAYQRHLVHTAPESATIEVHVVCNDEDMREEEIVTEFYGVRDLLEFRVQSHYNLTVDKTRELFEQEFDLLHFIGHNDENGIQCKDGYLDARTDIDSVGIEAFILNACRSVEQAEALIAKGAHGGICTLYDIPNSSATRVGRTLSRLLNRGFNLRSALDIARDASVLGRRWISLGDGRLALTQPESGIPILVHVEPLTGNRYRVELESYETLTHRLGAVTSPNTNWGSYSIIPGKSINVISRNELEQYLSLEVLPIKFDGDLYWSDEISALELV